MDKAVHYCCVAKGNRILQAYSGGDLELEKLAPLCLDKAPSYHRWYFQTMSKKTFGFLMDDGFTYFAIAGVDLGNHGLLRFLERVRNEFKKISTKKGFSGLKGKGSISTSNPNSGCLQDQMVPVIRQLIASLQNVSQTNNGGDPSPSSFPRDANYGEVAEAATSTRVPLLGKSTKDDHHHTIAMPARCVEMEGRCKSADRGFRNDSDPNNESVAVSPGPLQKDLSGSMRMRSGSQSVRRKWCRLVRVVLAIDAAVCIILLLVWLLICQGLQCIR